MWGFGRARGNEHPARGALADTRIYYFDEHERALKYTYRRSALSLPPTTAAFEAERWKVKLQALASVIIGRQERHWPQAIDADLEADESRLASLWICDRITNSSADTLTSQTLHQFANPIDFDAFGSAKPSVDTCSSAKPSGSGEENLQNFALRRIDVDEYRTTFSASWLQYLSHDNCAFLERIEHQHAELVSRVNLNVHSTPLIREEEEAELVGVYEEQFPCASYPKLETCAPIFEISPSSLARLELPTMHEVSPGCRFVKTMTKQHADLFECYTATHELLESATQNSASKTFTAWMSMVQPKEPDFLITRANGFSAVQDHKQNDEGTKNQSTNAVELQKIKLDEFAVQSPATILRDKSSGVLKKVLRKNAATMFVQEPDGLDFFKLPQVSQGATTKWNPWQDSVTELSRYSTVNSAADLQCLQQLLMPSKLTHQDEKGPDDALLRVIASGKQMLQKMRSPSSSLPPRPLTSIMLNIPSLWNQESLKLDGSVRFKETFEWMQLPSGNDEELENQTSKVDTDRLERDDTTKGRSEEGLEPKKTGEATVEAATSELDAPLVTEAPHKYSPMMFVMYGAGPTTTEDLVAGFLGVTSNELTLDSRQTKSLAKTPSTVEEPGAGPQGRLPIEHLARPVLWDLARKKVIRVNPNSIQCALEALSLELLESIVYQQQAAVKTISKNPSAFSHEAIFDVCASFRQVTWLHTLRTISLCGRECLHVGNAQLLFVTQVLATASYKLALGSSHWRDLNRLYTSLGGGAKTLGIIADLSSIEQKENDENEYGVTKEPPQKKPKLLTDEEDKIPVRVICSAQFLSHDEILDELSTEFAVSVIERELQSPIDLIVDERNGICVLRTSLFDDTSSMKSLTYKLATSQIQFQHLWLIIDHVVAVEDSPVPSTIEENLQAFFAALVHFRVEVRTFTSNSTSDEETSRQIRFIIDQCAQIALDDHRTLPRMWFERPFLLEEESQLERFLASTQIITPYAAQSLLHKISIEDLFNSR